MITQLFSVYDSKAKTFFKPFHCQNANVAERTFRTVVNDKTTEISKHPADYTLFFIGYFDDETGAVEPCSVHTNLGLGSQYVD